jgi:hypothetical protein
MVFFHVLIFMALPAGSLAAEAWDDFANNLATDLAPILQLFGEQVTKQFLSESTSILDNIIFAMAPLGILTAMVSVIRVCGSPVLRAFVGRAQEGAGVAEAELCSSTGRDVCEMYQNGAITRVFGRPRILELVHDSQDETFYKGYPEQIVTAGIYTFPEYYRTERGKKEWKETTTDNMESSLDEYAPNPNLMLNIGFKKPSLFILRATAFFGILLQCSVVAFAIVITKHLRLTKDGALPPPWALPSMIIGTVLLCFGMFMCAFLIEQSTAERTFSRSNSDGVKSHALRSTIHWIQPGGQVVGDQSFDSFAYSDAKRSLREYTSSWRRPVSQRDSYITWLAIAITMAGFIVQFVGLRGVHSTISVFQLCAILLMSVMRALLRTQRLDGKLNHLSSWPSDDTSKGHELDWLAFHLAHQTKDTMSSSFYQRLFSEANEPQAAELSLWRLFQISSTLTDHESKKLVDHESKSDESTSNTADLDQDFNLPVLGHSSTPYIRTSHQDMTKDARWLAQTEARNTVTSGPDVPNLAARIWHYRVRLCRMTSLRLPILVPQKAWPDDLVQGRSVALALSKVISEAATLILPRAAWNESTCKSNTLYISFHCGISNVNPTPPRPIV